MSRIGTPKGAVRKNVDTHVRQDIVEGVRWLMGNRPVRTLALVIVTFNITWAAPWSVPVLGRSSGSVSTRRASGC